MTTVAVSPRGVSPLEDLAKRTEKITKLFLVLGMDGTQEKIAGWVEATERVPLQALMLACRDLVQDWKRSQGWPFPGDLIGYAKPHVARARAFEAYAAQSRSLYAGPAPADLVPINPELVSGLVEGSKV